MVNGGGSLRARRAGMTLVEILVVLSIVGVMAGVVVLGVGVGDRGMGVESEANRLADRLRLAADDVLVTRRPLLLVFDPEGYQFVRGDGAATGPADAVEPLRERHALPAGVRMVGAGVSSPMTIDPDGAAPVAAFAFAKGDLGWRVTFDGLNAVVEPVSSARGVARMTRRAADTRAGYSLMEAMVALFILAIATVGITRATQQHIDGVRGLEQRVVAQWVAENRLVELNLEGGVAPAATTVRMMDRDWAVDVRTRATDDPDLLAVDLTVAEAGVSGAEVRLSGFVDRQAGGAS